tara:strand:- start:47 stop:895 length:849 start_codon:yes stop_codon:yes gene_type:complete
MSLYDLYYSNKNKKHMYELLFEITQNKLEENIFHKIFTDTFETTLSSTLLELNKELVEKICKIYNVIDITNNNIAIKGNNEILNTNNIDHSKKQEISKITSPDIPVQKKHITSSDRNSGNRYNYNITISDNIKTIEKLIIPKEDNDIFINNVIQLIIPELGINTLCYCTDTKKINNYIYGTYILEDNVAKKTFSNINIKIKSIYSDMEYTDITEITKIEEDHIIVNNLDLIKVGDYIKTDTGNNYKILEIEEDNKLILKDYKMGEEKEFINLNLQNIIIYTY